MRLRTALALLLAATATPVGAFELPYQLQISISFRNGPPLVSPPIGGVGELSLGAGGVLQSLALAPAYTGVSGVSVGNLPASWTPIDALRGSFGIWATSSPAMRTIARDGNGQLGGEIPMVGSILVCLFSPNGLCPGASNPLILLSTRSSFSSFPNQAIGLGGTWYQPGSVAFTVRGAPWQTGTVVAGAGVTGMGSARGPASLPGSTAQNGGHLNLVTPVFVTSRIGSFTIPFPGIARLEITFTGDPPACANGADDDGDGAIDAAADPGCSDENDVSEQDPALPCDDGVDNDGDGWIDHPDDPACMEISFFRENAQCQDGVSNDGDGLIDFDGGASWNGGAPLTAPDPQCVGKPQRDKETAGCGLGAEFVLAYAALLAWRRRRAR